MNNFVANTRIKKLKKLFVVSRDIISQFGLKYFLHVFFEELAKQKSGIFSTDESPKIDFEQFSLNYETFRQQYDIKPNDLQLIKKNISEFPKLPTFSLIIIITKNINKKNLLNSINSVLNQYYENFDLFIIDLTENISNLDDVKNEFDTNKIKLISGKNNSIKLDQIMLQTTGDFIGFLDASIFVHSDLLYQVVKKFNQIQTSEIFYTDNDSLDPLGNRINPFFKPDWSPYLLRSMNYLGTFCIIKKTVFEQIDEFRINTYNDFIYDLFLKCSEITDKFTHVSLPLFSTTSDIDSQFSKSTKLSIFEHLKRLGINSKVEQGIFPGTFRVHYNLDAEPKISIIIPTKDNKDLLKRCINSIKNNTSYKNWEIVIIDNNNTDKDAINFLESLPYQIIKFSEPFNFSKMNNLAASKTNGDYLLFLNDDTAALEPNWLTEMVSICHQHDVGAVGAKLIFSDNTIQHAGIVFLKTGAGFHPFQQYPEKDSGYFNFINVIRDFSAVTGACLLVKKQIFTKIGGFDNDFDLYYGDSDLCFKIRDLGYHVVYTPHAKLLHEGSASIQKHSDAFFTVENHYSFLKKWPFLKNGDPFYNPNLGWNYSIAKPT